MHKIDSAGHASNLFTEGNPATATAATTVSAAWLNAVQTEIVNVVEYTGAALSKPDNTQLLTAILSLVAGATAAVPVGTSLEWNFATAPAGYLFEDGKTIGNATSGATSRANADTLTLYTGLWNSWSNTELPIQDSSGSPTTRGADATADFNAGKRLPLPDSRGRNTIGKDDMGGTAANRITSGVSGIAGATLGAAGGDQRLHQHTHTATVTDPGHAHDFSGTHGNFNSSGDPNIKLATVLNLETRSVNTATTGVTVSNANAGAGNSQNVQPGIVKNKIIKY